MPPRPAPMIATCVAPDAPEVVSLVVVWLENRGRTREDVRLDLAGLIKKTRGLVKGMAIDFALICPSDVDRVLCSYVKGAPGALLFTTRIIQETKDLASLAPISPGLKTCIDNDKIGHPALVHHQDGATPPENLDRDDPCLGQAAGLQGATAETATAETVTAETVTTGTVTAVPNYFEADPTRPSLSLLAARALGLEAEPPKLLFFLPPKS